MNCQICSSPTHILYPVSLHIHILFAVQTKKSSPKPCGAALSAALTSFTLDRLNEVPGIIIYKCHAHIHNQPQLNCELRRQNKNNKNNKNNNNENWQAANKQKRDENFADFSAASKNCQHDVLCGKWQSKMLTSLSCLPTGPATPPSLPTVETHVDYGSTVGNVS